MPRRALSPCRQPGCPNLADCAVHARPARTGPARSSAAAGYGYQWQQIRAEVLRRAGIPRADWPRYDVDHDPPYNPSLQPDHRRYTLTPMLRSAHARKTARQDGGFGNRKRAAG